MQKLTNFLFRSITPRDIKYLQAPSFNAVSGLSAEIYQQMAEDFQLVPPIVLHHSLPRVMAGLWAASREAYVADLTGRGLREAVGASVSKINRCPYCVDVHVAMLHGLGNDLTARAIRDGKGEADETSRQAMTWAEATLTPGAPILHRPPFPLAVAPRIIGTALLFHYINRMVHLFLPNSPLPIPSSLGWLKRSAGTLFGRTVGRNVVSRTAGVAPYPLADESAHLPIEFEWARSDGRVAHAFALFAKVAEEAGATYLDEQLRQHVSAHIAAWQGEPPGLSRSWLDTAAPCVPAKSQPAARLALLTALAPYQVTPTDIATFKQGAGSDAALIGVTSWASFQAMKRVSSWLHLPK